MDRNRVSELLKILSPLQEKVVRLYFGLGCQRSHSASEIAREFHVSSQVISGIIGGAERRLAHEGLTPSKLREAASFEAEISRKPEQECSANVLRFVAAGVVVVGATMLLVRKTAPANR